MLLNRRRINACLTLACMHDGDEITTIEGLGEPGRLSALQRAFVAHDGYQCGYCTPGQICSATAVLVEIEDGWPSHVTEDLLEAPAPTAAEIAERMSGNLCRCGAYPKHRRGHPGGRLFHEEPAMRPFEYVRADFHADAVEEGAADGAAFIAGGTNLLDLMKIEVMAPDRVVDITRLDLDGIEATERGLRIGALVTNSELAGDMRVRTGYPPLSQALLAWASGQLRNKATTGGSLLQRTC